MRYDFRPCTDDDREWAYALKREAYQAVVESQFGKWDDVFQRDHFCAHWNPGRSRIITVDGNAVGLLTTREHADAISIDEIQLSNTWRGKGLGTLILRDLMQQAGSSRKPIRLQVLKHNTRARELYHRLGFVTTGETKTHYLMEKSLSTRPGE